MNLFLKLKNIKFFLIAIIFSDVAIQFLIFGHLTLDTVLSGIVSRPR